MPWLAAQRGRRGLFLRRRAGRSESASPNCHLSAYVGGLSHGCKPGFKNARPILRSRTEFVLRPWLFAAKAFTGSPGGPVISIAADDLAAARIRNGMAGSSRGLGKFLGGLRGCHGATAAESGNKAKDGKREQVSHENLFFTSYACGWPGSTSPVPASHMATRQIQACDPMRDFWGSSDLFSTRSVIRSVHAHSQSRSSRRCLVVRW